MIVWGGAGDTTGGRYDPAADSWTATSVIIGVPSARVNHTAVWTGSGMILWGGYNNTIYFSDGARYNPVDDSWTAVSNIGAPAWRKLHTAVWTDSAMIVWGGNSGSTCFNDMFSYTPGRLLYLYQRP